MMIFSGCQRAYYAAWESVGKEKRHLLKDEVKDVHSDQEKAAEEFKDVLTRIKEIYGFKGGNLEKVYNKLNDDYQDCEERAETVRKRIQSVEDIASDLFKEWEKEIREISNENFRSKSMQTMRETKDRYSRLRSAMTTASKKMDPVLRSLKDYVLYLKHNLNAQAVGALKQEVGDIEYEVESLIQDISSSVREAEDFLKNFK
jgi:paraquat-inducible protein B